MQSQFESFLCCSGMESNRSLELKLKSTIVTHLIVFHIIGSMFQYVQYHLKLPNALAVAVFSSKTNAFLDGLISAV